ncbi:hypothetical protein ADUPG1_013893, partial [Aduncisulcus paluster]
WRREAERVSKEVMETTAGLNEDALPPEHIHPHTPASTLFSQQGDMNDISPVPAPMVSSIRARIEGELRAEQEARYASLTHEQERVSSHRIHSITEQLREHYEETMRVRVRRARDEGFKEGKSLGEKSLRTGMQDVERRVVEAEAARTVAESMYKDLLPLVGEQRHQMKKGELEQSKLAALVEENVDLKRRLVIAEKELEKVTRDVEQQESSKVDLSQYYTQGDIDKIKAEAEARSNRAVAEMKQKILIEAEKQITIAVESVEASALQELELAEEKAKQAQENEVLMRQHLEREEAKLKAEREELKMKMKELEKVDVESAETSTIQELELAKEKAKQAQENEVLMRQHLEREEAKLKAEREELKMKMKELEKVDVESAETSTIQELELAKEKAKQGQENEVLMRQHLEREEAKLKAEREELKMKELEKVDVESVVTSSIQELEHIEEKDNQAQEHDTNEVLMPHLPDHKKSISSNADREESEEKSGDDNQVHTEEMDEERDEETDSFVEIEYIVEEDEEEDDGNAIHSKHKGEKEDNVPPERTKTPVSVLRTFEEGKGVGDLKGDPGVYSPPPPVKPTPSMSSDNPSDIPPKPNESASKPDTKEEESEGESVEDIDALFDADMYEEIEEVEELDDDAYEEYLKKKADKKKEEEAEKVKIELEKQKRLREETQRIKEQRRQEQERQDNQSKPKKVESKDKGEGSRACTIM